MSIALIVLLLVAIALSIVLEQTLVPQEARERFEFSAFRFALGLAAAVLTLGWFLRWWG